MKVSELLPSKTKFNIGQGIDVRTMNLVTKTQVAPGHLDRIELPLLGITMKQVQSTGDTSRPEIPMAKYKTHKATK